MRLTVMLLGAIIACSAADRTAPVSGPMSPIANRDKTGTTAGGGHDGVSQTEFLYLLTELASFEANSPGRALGVK
jgi:hypothetical protein